MLDDFKTIDLFILIGIILAVIGNFSPTNYLIIFGAVLTFSCLFGKLLNAMWNGHY